jgi:hypothetical protein
VIAERDNRDTGATVDREAGPTAGQVDDDDVRPARNRVRGVWTAGGQVAQPVGAGEAQSRGTGRISVGLVLNMR